jgi:hypothetical protein
MFNLNLNLILINKWLLWNGSVPFGKVRPILARYLSTFRHTEGRAVKEKNAFVKLVGPRLGMLCPLCTWVKFFLHKGMGQRYDKGHQT